MLDLIKSIIMLLIGSPLALIGFGAIFFMASDCEFNCERISKDRGVCQFVEKSIMSEDVNEFNIKDIKKVWLQTIEAPDEGSTASYDVILSLNNGDSLSLINGDTSYGKDEMKNYLSKINGFIEDPERKSLKAQYKGSYMVYAVGAIFAFVGVMMLYGAISPLLKKIFS